ncbi:CocE/NonD family hydrolase [Actinocorallia longicatena]|uniref:CocE/NonD family hydrolase n=1 Tax=Actinocorallia longicatena TaxID=111803 RepID=A0ABP6QHF7_9ACTN
MPHPTHPQKTGPAAPPPDAVPLTIPMRDGVTLAADLYVADPGLPNAVVLVRLPYDKDGPYCFMPEIARYLLAGGYTVVVQDVRGKYRSQGRTEFALHEPGDGHDTLEWISRQPWSDGDVVMWGDSYYGYTAIAAASAGHPALKAIAPRLTGSQLSMVLDHGDGTGDVEQTARKMYFASHYVNSGRYEWEPDWSVRPLREEFERFFTGIGERSACFDAEFEGATPFVPPPVKALLASPPVPALYTIGWFDNCAVWSWHDVRALAADPAWSEGLRLRLEATDHENYRLADAPVAPGDDHTADPAALARMLPRYLDPALAFFDAVLGRSCDLAAFPRVRYEVCHGAWHDGDAWPPPHAAELSLTLGSGGRLGTAPPDRERLLEWVHDPADPVPSPGANPFAALFDRADLSAAGDRPDVVRFTGPAVDADTDLLGGAVLLLRMAAPAGTHVHARLLDASPGGAAHLIARGQVRCDGRPPERETVLDLLDVAYRLRAGHRLVLDLMSGDFPDFVPEATVGADPWTSPHAGPSARGVVLGGSPASRLLIGGPQPHDLRSRA